jgi:hypothetical protein
LDRLFFIEQVSEFFPIEQILQLSKWLH